MIVVLAITPLYPKVISEAASILHRITMTQPKATPFAKRSAVSSRIRMSVPKRANSYVSAQGEVKCKATSVSRRHTVKASTHMHYRVMHSRARVMDVCDVGSEPTPLRTHIYRYDIRCVRLGDRTFNVGSRVVQQGRTPKVFFLLGSGIGHKHRKPTACLVKLM